MAVDLQNFSVTSLGNKSVSVNIERYQLSCQVVDSATQALIADLTGANAITWPDVLTTLTAAQRQDLLLLVRDHLIRLKAGLT